MSVEKDREKQARLALLVGLGCMALIFYFAWWFQPWQLEHSFLFVVLTAALTAAGPQLLGNWVLYLKAAAFHARPEPGQAFSVDVYVTAYCESPELVRSCVIAARHMNGQHETYLLDDSPGGRFAALARECGVHHLTRPHRTHAKAGNINAALPRTHGEIIAVFDVDHVPAPDFLERSLSYFQNPRIGFVQVMLTFSNSRHSWIARAATEGALDYYNPTCRGAAQMHAVTLTGSNALIRRTALESIGGYQPGLAEDLATSIELHSAAWQSVYVPEPLAPGLAPVDQLGWHVQQFKWSRGVFEILLTRLAPLFARLTNGERLSYLVRMTYYWIGPAVGAHLLATIFVLFSGDPVVYRAYAAYLFHLAPLAVCAMAIRQTALSNHKLPSTSGALLWRPVALVFATWPTYTLAWVMAILRIPLCFQPTPKTKGRAMNPIWLTPQALSMVLLATGSIVALSVDPLAALPGVAVALMMILAQLPFLMQYAPARHNLPEVALAIEPREAPSAH